MFERLRYSRTSIVIWLLMWMTLLITYFANYVVAPSIIKMIFSASLWLCVISFPFRFLYRNGLDKYAWMLLIVILLLAIISTLRSVLSASGVVIGNKWLTLFGNPECMFMLLTPCFAFLSCDTKSLIILRRAVSVFLLIGALGIFLGHFVSRYIIFIAIVFYPYFNRVEKILSIIAFLSCAYLAFIPEDTSRTMIIVMFFVLASYILAYKVKNKRLIRVFCSVCIIVPVVIALLMIILSEYSVISDLMAIILQKTGDDVLSTDTRSFLFSEVAQDLSDNHSWLMGKGAYSHYFSPFFLASTTGNGDHYERLCCEVTLLQLLLRGGILYTLAYYGLIVFAVRKILVCANNRFFFSVAIIASGWVAMSSISYLNGCDFLHLGFFLLLGCGLSRKWLSRTDGEMNEMLLPNNNILFL